MVSAKVDQRREAGLRTRARLMVAALGLLAERGVGFRLAAEALGSTVTLLDTSVYDLDPTVLGTFDVVTCANSFHHYPNQDRAVELFNESLDLNPTFLEAF